MPMISHEGLNRRGSIIHSLIIINIGGHPHMYYLLIHADHLEVSNNDSELTLHFHLIIPVSFFQTPHHQYPIPSNLRINQSHVHIEEVLGESSSTGSNNGSDQDQDQDQDQVLHAHIEELGESSNDSSIENDQDQDHIHIEELGEISTSSSSGGDQAINGHLAYYVVLPSSSSSSSEDDDGSDDHGHDHVDAHENGF